MLPMYGRTGVIRPGDHTGALDSLAQTWSSVATASEAASQGNADARGYIIDRNEGEVADAFAASTEGDSSAVGGLKILAEKAEATSTAHRGASQVTGNARTAMDALCAQAEKEYWKWKLVPVVGRVKRAALVIRTRKQLKSMESDAVAAIEGLYGGLSFPEPLVREGNQDESYGTVPDDVRTRWDELDEDEKKRVLQNIADEYARKNGLPPTPIEWNSHANGHWDPKTQRLHIDPSILNDPSAMATVVHESQHGKQFRMMDEYNNMSDDDRAAIRDGRKPDPFAQYGSNIDEVARQEKNWDGGKGYHDYDGKGDERSDSWRNYYGQPMEHDARRSGTEFMDGLTADDIDKYL